MKQTDIDRLRSIKTFPSLVKYLRDELDWPIDSDGYDDLTFEYEPEELGLEKEIAVKIKEIKQLRPLITGQQWGIFFINFEPKRLPVVVLRRVLQKLVIRKRASANKSQMPTWNLHDLLFISTYGESNERSLTFAHFSEDPNTGELPTLRVLGWDDQDTVLHLDHAHTTLKEKLSWPGNPDDIQGWRKQWSEAFTLRHREVITTSRELAIRLAALATRIRKRVNAILRVESDKGSFTQLHQAFKEALIHDLNDDDFADMYAQTITYGLLAARVSRPMGVVTENLAQLVSNPFLKEMLSTFLTFGGKKGKIDFDEAGILDVVELLNSPDTNIDAVLRDFGNRTQREDPVIHFYELFLTEYDKKKKVERGVFYTPQPVVSYIVRSVHELLQTEFGLEDGLASTVTWGEMAKRNKEIKLPKGVSTYEPFVQVLDPAVGTGTFLVEVIDVVAKTMIGKWEKAGRTQTEMQKLWDEYVGKHLLPRLYGYELMMAPYVIADIKLTLKLTEISRQLGELFYHAEGKGRFNIYLTNSLEPPSQVADEKLADLFLPLAHEAKAVNRIKREKRFSIVVGNPPYSQYSMNLSEAAKKHIARFRFANGARIRARNALQLERNLNDDYVKFLGLSSELFALGTGVLGIITNRMFLDSESLVGLREWFCCNFERIYILDLWGSSEESRRIERLAKDKNVFDIQQGVAISICVRRRIPSDVATPVFSREVIGSRETKYSQLNTDLEINGEAWNEVYPKPKNWWMHRTISSSPDITSEFTLVDIFPRYSTLIASNRDHLVVSLDHTTVLKNVGAVQSFEGSNEELAEKFDLTLKAGWNVQKAREKLRAVRSLPDYIQMIEYRPFDRRWIFFHPSLVWQTAPIISDNLSNDKHNRVLISLGKNRAETLNGQWVANTLADKSVVSSRDNASGFPLFLYEANELEYVKDAGRPNLSTDFLRDLSKRLNLPQAGEFGLPQGVTPLDIFNYVYALLYSPNYRMGYSESLTIDFPRIPLTSNIELFHALAKLGAELVALHLMESPKLDKHTTKFVGKEMEVEKVTYSNNTVWIDKAQTSGFKEVPENVWEFHIGGYQVCEKWLKDRRGRSLTKEEIEHYHRIVVALNETIRLMAEIDKVIDEHGGWPIT